MLHGVVYKIVILFMAKKFGKVKLDMVPESAINYLNEGNLYLKS